jgi:hypothetical protein
MLRKDAAEALGHPDEERDGQYASDNCSLDEPLSLAFVRENIVHRQLRDCHNDHRHASRAEPNCSGTPRHYISSRNRISYLHFLML